MITFIAARIEEQARLSLEQGQDKYRAYFVRTTLYLKYKPEVDAILIQDGFSEVIVSA